MKAYKKYIEIMQETSCDRNFLISTEKGDFSVEEIMSMSKHLHKKDGKKCGIWGKETIGFFNRIIRKLAIRRGIVTDNAAAISNIAASKYYDKRVIYVSNYNDSGSGPSVFNTNWNGTHSICIEYPDYIDVRYTDYEKVDNYYFFKTDFSNKIMAFDEKGLNYLLFSRLNHEQKVARDFIEFIGESFNTLNIKHRYDLSALCEDILNGKFGKVRLIRNNEDSSDDSAEAEIQTPHGLFIFKAVFSGYERKDFMRDLLNNQKR